MVLYINIYFNLRDTVANAFGEAAENLLKLDDRVILFFYDERVGSSWFTQLHYRAC